MSKYPIPTLLVEHFGGIWGLPEEYRRAHAEYERFRSRGVPIADMPERVRYRERVYQAVKQSQRRRRVAP